LFTRIRKRDGREAEFTDAKITDAIFKAAKAVGGEDRQTAVELTVEVLKQLKKQFNGDIFSVEDVQDAVEKILIEAGHARTAKAYILYRAQRTRMREAKSELMDAVEEILVETNRENANIGNSPSAKMLQIASAASKRFYLTRLIPEDFSLSHSRGDIHIHDLDFYGKTLNCVQIPLGKLLQEGFDNGHGYIRPPKRPGTATAQAAIILQSSQNDMYGGQSFAFFDRDIAPYVANASEDETFQAMEALIFNLNSMHSLSGQERIWVFDKYENRLAAKTMAQFHEVYEPNRYQAFSLNYSTGKTELRDIVASFKHPNIHPLLGVKLRQGQSVVVTDNHSMMAFNDRGDITVSPPKELAAGLTPAKLSLEGPENVYDLECYPASRKYPLDKLPLSCAQAKFMGYYVAEGSVCGSSIYLALFDSKLEEDVAEVLRQISPGFWTRVKTDRLGRRRDLVCNVGQRFAAFIADTCGRGAENKRIPTEIFFAGEDVVKAFLDGYLSGDGTVGKKRIAATTVSKELRDGLKLLCAKLGIPCSIREAKQPKTNFAGARPRYLIAIGGVYGQDVSLTGRDTSHLKDVAIEQTPYDYEWLRILIKEVYGVKGWVSRHYRITPDVIDRLVGDLEKRLSSIDFEQVAKIGSEGYLLEVIRQVAARVATTERYHLLKLARKGILPSGTKFFPVLADYAGVLQTLYLPESRGDFFLKNTVQSPRAVIRWSKLVLEQGAKMYRLLQVLRRCREVLPVRVKEIVNCPHEEFVYDISVADNENFLTAEGIFVHNSRAGAQVPFSSLNVGTETSEEGRKVTRNLLLAYERGLGRGENPIFPNIIFRVKDGINFKEGDPNYDLFRLAIKVSSQRLNPTFSFMDSSFNKEFGTEVSYMGCRTRVISNRLGPEVTDRRGNLTFTTINLPRLGIKAERNLKLFYKGLEEVMELAGAQLLHRYKVQGGLKVRDLPFLMGQAIYLDSEKLRPDDCIEPAIKHGTLSIGFIGLAETLVALCGKHHGETAEAQELGLEVMSFMRRKVDELADKYNLNYSFLATPAEGLSGRFAGMDRKEFKIIPGVTDKEYYTNSFHVPVGFGTSFHHKVTVEGGYHKFTNGGHISYVEMDAPPIHNLEAVETIIRHMKASDMGYAGINFPVDFCMACSHRGVFPGDECPVCGATDIKRVRRITGYLSTVDRFNDSKVAELRDRKAHRLSK